MKKLIYFSIIMCFLITFVSAVDVTECVEDISSGGVYVLTQNISDAGSDCFGLNSDDIVFDCNGYSIIGFGNPFIMWGDNQVSNITIKNCYLYNFSDEVFNLYWIDGLLVENNYAETSGGVILNIQNTYNGVYRNNVFVGDNACIDFQDDSEYTSENNSFYNNYFECSSWVEVSSSETNTFFNTSQQTGERVYSEGVDIGGNYWVGYSDICDDLDTDGFCDNPYDILGDESFFDYLAYSDEYAFVIDEEEITPPAYESILLYKIMNSSGAGLGIFLQIMAVALPTLIFGLAIVGIIVAFGVAFSNIFSLKGTKGV